VPIVSKPPGQVDGPMGKALGCAVPVLRRSLWTLEGRRKEAPRVSDLKMLHCIPPMLQRNEPTIAARVHWHPK
jgi:hypothetical protein